MVIDKLNNGGAGKMGKLFTREQARQFLKENNLKDADSIGDALVAQFKDLLQEALEAEMDHELDYSKYDWKNKENSNSRNGHTKKTIKSRFGEMELSTPRDGSVLNNDRYK